MNCDINEIANRLKQQIGHRSWQSHGDPIDELVATILSQNTSDTNTARAFASLRARFPTWQSVIDASLDEVAESIRSGGLANLKAPRIQAVLLAIQDRFGALNLDRLRHLSVRDARAELTKLKGVGPKTASCVLLFSFGMPAMPVDTHVHRVTQRLGIVPVAESAEAAHETLERALGADRDEVYAFHMNLIAHGRTVCLARKPRCERCTLAECCDYINKSGEWRSTPI
jgi:endonuclease-3